MIAIDFSGMVYRHCHTVLKNPTDLTMNNVRHYVLNDIRTFRKRFFSEYGEIVLCYDNTHSGNWRKEVFPEYKAKRKEGRDKSVFNWELFFEYFDQIKNELKDHFPYIVIDVPNCEADDAIGWLAENKDPFEKMMIISADKDFKQLQRYSLVRQWSYLTKKFLDEPKPLEYIREHSIRGDVADGVPNVYSDDDVFIDTLKKQKSVMTKDIQRWSKLPLKIVLDELAQKLVVKPTKKRPNEVTIEEARKTIASNWKRNYQMVDLSLVPDEYKSKIEEQFLIPPKGKANKLYSYFIKNKLPIMINYLEEFV